MNGVKTCGFGQTHRSRLKGRAFYILSLDGVGCQGSVEGSVDLG